MTLIHSRFIALAAILAASACGGGDKPNFEETGADGTSGDDGIMTLSQGTSSTNGTTDTESATDGMSGSGGESSTGFTPNLNCMHVDFLFVIDNSVSMQDEQENLVNAVPGFVESMQTALPTVQSFRVGVVDSDSYPGIGTVENPLDGCPEGTDCTVCDYQLGALLSKPLSAEDPMATCDYSSGQPFMDGESDTFATEFQCAAIVGTEGNPVEQQIGAMVQAVSPDLNGDGACNAGFVRDSALLVVMLISDEEDDYNAAPAPQGGSMGEPADWYQALVDAKDGKESNVVALGLIGGSPRFPDCPELGPNLEGAEQTSRLQQFYDMFETSFTGSVCADTYATFFQDALDAVSQGCMNFIP
jgi:hypothetical protein